MNYQLIITLLSDATFGRGDGVAGIIDTEIEHDTATGLPYVRGRSVRGLLVEECANLLFALDRAKADTGVLHEAAGKMFGRPGSREGDCGTLRVGAAKFPADVQTAIRAAIDAGDVTASDVLELLTGVRRQTAVDDERNAPRDESLRVQRYLLRETCLVADLEFARMPSEDREDQLALLSAAAHAIRRGGTGRNRGRGRLCVTLKDAASQSIVRADRLFLKTLPASRHSPDMEAIA